MPRDSAKDVPTTRPATAAKTKMTISFPEPNTVGGIATVLPSASCCVPGPEGCEVAAGQSSAL